MCHFYNGKIKSKTYLCAQHTSQMVAVLVHESELRTHRKNDVLNCKLLVQDKMAKAT